MEAPQHALAQPAKATQADNEAAIKTARLTQAKAMTDEDINRVVSYWAPDITIRRALGQTLTGAAEVRKIIESAANTPPSPTRMIYQRLLRHSFALLSIAKTYTGRSQMPI